MTGTAEVRPVAGGAPGPLTIWLMAARPRTLTAAIVPVWIGTAVAIRDGALAPLPALAALLGAILIQIGTNLANDYFDAAKGADKERRGPVRVTQAGLVPPGRMRAAIGITFGLAVLCGLYLAFVGGWPIVVIGLLSIASGLAYTGGPYPLGYHGLGDLFVFVFFGLIATVGTYYVQALRVSALSVWAAVPMGCLTVAILVANNLRDIDSDRRAGKRTLVARYGRRFGQIEYAAALLLALAIPMLLVAARQLRPAGLLPILATPLAWRLLRGAYAPDPSLADHLRLLAGTSWFLVGYGLLLFLGIVL
jgi:1,4-dihydroxy-2-naphthoate polyprenyltransferase